jgi:hypothetical protein
MAWYQALLGPVVESVTGLWANRQKRKAQKQELDAAIHMQKIEYVKLGRVAEVEWNKASVNKAGWRPGFLTIILSAPMILVFIPDLVPYIREGFAVLETTPVWYRSAIAVMISSAFGFKKFADWQMSKHYTLPDPMNVVAGKQK